MHASTVGIGAPIAVCLLVAVVVLPADSRLVREVEQGGALIVSKLRKVDVTFTGQAVLPVLHEAELRGTLPPEQAARWADVKPSHVRAQALGGAEDDQLSTPHGRPPTRPEER